MSETNAAVRSKWRRIGAIAAQIVLIAVLIVLIFVMWLPWIVSSKGGAE